MRRMRTQVRSLQQRLEETSGTVAVQRTEICALQHQVRALRQPGAGGYMGVENGAASVELGCQDRPKLADIWELKTAQRLSNWGARTDLRRGQFDAWRL
jgi:hypothetical protein